MTKGERDQSLPREMAYDSERRDRQPATRGQGHKPLLRKCGNRK